MRLLASPNVSVDRIFRSVVAFFYVVLLALMAWQFTQRWQTYQHATVAVHQFVVFQQSIAILGDVAHERDASDAVLGEELPVAKERLANLATMREQTDTDIRQLQRTILALDCERCANWIQLLNQTKSSLATSRLGVDNLLRQERSARPGTDIANIISHTVLAVGPLRELSKEAAATVIDGSPGAVGYMYVAGFTAALRDSTGVLGAQFTAALAARRALTREEALAIEHTKGTIDQLRLMLRTITRRSPALPPQLIAHIEREYFTDGYGYVAKVDALSQTSGANITTGQFADYYVPLLEPLEVMRDAALGVADDIIHQNVKRQRALLGNTVLVVTFMTIAFLLLIWQFHKRIVRPFVEARHFIQAIAHGDVSATIPKRPYRGEIKELFSALLVLKANSEERLKLSIERQQLIAELKTMADTDALTGLLNRRAFETLANDLLMDARAPTPYVAAVVFDIDHFKRINDTYGHATGDLALQKLAELCRQTWRQGDIVGRLGGEEFGALVCIAQPEQATESAQRLMRRLHGTQVTGVDGEVFSMTVSFGVTWAKRESAPELAALLQRADELMYQAKAGGRDRIEAGALS